MKRFASILVLLAMVAVVFGQQYQQNRRNSFKTRDIPGLILWWQFNAESSSSAIDSSGSGYNGRYTNSPTLAEGIRGKSLSLNGTSQYVISLNTNMLNTQQAGTVSLWIKTSAAAWTTILQYGSQSDTYANWQLETDDTGKLWLEYQRAPDFGWASFVSSKPVNDNNWHHITLTADGITAVKYYVDSVQDSFTFTPAETIYGSDSDWFADISGLTTYPMRILVGAFQRNAAASGFLAGSIDDVRIYNRALTAAEVQMLYLYP